MKRRLLSFAAMVLTGVIGYFAYLYISTPAEVRGMKKVESYHYVDDNQATCMALTPECGYCPGTVHDKECYVSRDQQY